jgi:hypothetical protein
LRLEPAVFATSRQQTTSSATSLPNCSGDDSAASSRIDPAVAAGYLSS